MLDTRPAPAPAASRSSVPWIVPDAEVALARPIEVPSSSLVAEPQFATALACGAAAAFVGASIWAAVTFAIDFQIGWMAVGVGAGVGSMVRRAGRSAEPRFGVAAAALALAGCVAGNLFAAVAYVASFTHVPYFRVLASLDAAAAVDLVKATSSPLDVLFGGIAMAEAYKLALARTRAVAVAAAPPTTSP